MSEFFLQTTTSI